MQPGSRRREPVALGESRRELAPQQRELGASGHHRPVRAGHECHDGAVVAGRGVVAKQRAQRARRGSPEWHKHAAARVDDHGVLGDAH